MATKARSKRAPKVAEPEKENVVDEVPMPAVAAKKTAATKTKGLKDNSNLALEQELEAMTNALKKVSLEKEESEAKLKEKENELQNQVAEAERVQNLLKSSDEGKKKLEEKLRKLQKVKEFQPTLVITNFFEFPSDAHYLSNRNTPDSSEMRNLSKQSHSKGLYSLWLEKYVITH